MGTAQIGGLLIAGGILAFVLGKLPTIRSIALFLGTVLVGTSGHVLSWLTTVMAKLAALTSGIFAWGFGVLVPGLLAFILLVFLIHAWHPRNKAGRMASVAAVALGVMVAAGITNVGLLNSVQPGVQSTVSTTTGG